MEKNNTMNINEFIDSNLYSIKISIENNLDEQQKSILMKRYLYSESLQEIGNYFGLTRERIRQLEDKSIRLIYKNLDLKKLHNPNTFLIDKSCFQKENILYIEILKKIYSKFFKKINIFESEYTILITKLKKAQIYRIKEEIKKILLFKGLPFQIKDVEIYLKNYNQFYKYFFEKILEELEAVKQDEKIIYYKKISKIEIVELILRGINKPLHVNTITNIFENLSKEKTTSHNIDSFLQRNENIFIVDRGTFFLRDKIYEILGKKLIKEIKDKSYKILKELGQPSDTVFLLSKLKEELYLPEIINPYLLKSLLKEDERFCYGRKFEILLKEFNLQERIESEELILKILENSKKSLSISEIQDELIKRGRNIPYATINMTFIRGKKIIKVKNDRYNSLNNFNISKNDIILFENIAVKILNEHCFPISLEYIAEKIKAHNKKFLFLNRYILYSLFKNNNKFEIIYEKLLKLNNAEYNLNTYEKIFKYILSEEEKPLKINKMLEKYKYLTKDIHLNYNTIYSYVSNNKEFYIVNGFIFLKEWKKENFLEILFEINKPNIEASIKEYLFYKKYTISSFDPKKEKDKIEEYKKVSEKYKSYEPNNKEKIIWIKYLVKYKRPAEILQLMKYINTSSLTDEEKEYLNSVEEMFY